MATYLILLFLLLTFCGFITCDIGPRNPLLETVSYLNDVSSDGSGKVHVSLHQTQLLIDTIWSRAGCGRDLDPVLCKQVSIPINIQRKKIYIIF